MLGIPVANGKMKAIILLTGVFLILFAGLRGEMVGVDYSNYNEIYTVIRSSGIFSIAAEPTFVLLSILLPSLRLLMIIFAAISISIKFKALSEITPFVLLSVSVWFANYFMIQEMNQVRAAAAISILLYGVRFIMREELLKFSLVVIGAALFHYSALVFFPLYFINKSKIEIIYSFLIPVAYALHLAGIGLIELMTYLPIPVLQAKLDAYNYLYSMGLYTDISLYSPVIFFRIIIIYVLISNWKTIQNKNKYFIILLKSSILSIVLLVLFSGLPAISIRISEIFASTEIILLPFLLYVYKPRKIILLLVFMIGLLLLSDNLFIRQFVNKYSF